MVWHNLVCCKVAVVYSSLVCDGEDFGTFGYGGGVRENRIIDIDFIQSDT